MVLYVPAPGVEVSYSYLTACEDTDCFTRKIKNQKNGNNTNIIEIK
jgi:hypothetical protein